MFQDFLRYSLSNMRHRKIRSWLTILGIFIGIAAVISLISISQGMRVAITEQFEMMGSDKLMVMPGGMGMMGAMGGMTSGELTDHDIDVIKRVKEVKSITGFLYSSTGIKFNKKIAYTFVIGLPLESEHMRLLEDMQSFKLDNGRKFKTTDKYKVLVGYLLYHDDYLFGKKIKIGDRIEIEDHEFKVIGNIGEIGNRIDDSQVYIPIDTARELFDEPEELQMIFVQVEEGEDPSEVADKVEQVMRKDRDLKEGEEDFTVQTSEQLMQQIGTILGIIQLILIGVAGISLLVGGVGIMNTMYTSVLERTREIGIMKAIGAKNRDILSIFLIESGIIGLVGGIIGCTLGVIIAIGVEIGAAQAGFGMLKASITPELILIGLGFSFFVGCISGTLPAKQASKLKPVDALRYE